MPEISAPCRDSRCKGTRIRESGTRGRKPGILAHCLQVYHAILYSRPVITRLSPWRRGREIIRGVAILFRDRTALFSLTHTTHPVRYRATSSLALNVLLYLVFWHSVPKTHTDRSCRHRCGLRPGGCRLAHTNACVGPHTPSTPHTCHLEPLRALSALPLLTPLPPRIPLPPRTPATRQVALTLTRQVASRFGRLHAAVGCGGWRPDGCRARMFKAPSWRRGQCRLRCVRGTRAKGVKHELIPARAAQCQTRGDAVARPEVRANPRVKP